MDTALLTLVVLEAVVIAVLAVLVFGLLRSHADILRSLHRLGAGEDLEAAAVPFGPGRGCRLPDRGTAAADLSGSRPGGGAVRWPSSVSSSRRCSLS